MFVKQFLFLFLHLAEEGIHLSVYRFEDTTGSGDTALTVDVLHDQFMQLSPHTVAEGGHFLVHHLVFEFVHLQVLLHLRHRVRVLIDGQLICRSLVGDIIDDMIAVVVLADIDLRRIDPRVDDDIGVLTGVEHTVDQVLGSLDSVYLADLVVAEEDLTDTHTGSPRFLILDIHRTLGDVLLQVIADGSGSRTQFTGRGDERQGDHLRQLVHMGIGVEVLVLVINEDHGVERTFTDLIAVLDIIELNRRAAEPHMHQIIEVEDSAIRVWSYLCHTRTGHRFEDIRQHGIAG